MRRCLLLAMLASPGLLAAQEAAPSATAAQDPYAAELQKLVTAFEEAQNAFYEQYAALSSDEERRKFIEDRSKQPSEVFRPRFEELAQRAKGTDAAAGAWIWVLQLTQDENKSKQIVDDLTANYITAPAMEELANHLRYGWYAVGREPAEKALRAVLERSPHAGAQAASGFVLGSILMEDPAQAAAARLLLTRVKERHPDTPYGKLADGYLFELDHLQIGMVAPDFEATDESGAPFRLSDYRGKVVVLDFWGFW